MSHTEHGGAPPDLTSGAGCSAGGDATGDPIPLSRLVRTGGKPAAGTGEGLAPARVSTLLIVPPFCSPNYTYPAPAYLARFLGRRGHTVAQADLNLELMLKIFCRAGLTRVFSAAEAARARGPISDHAARVLNLQARYISTVDEVIRFLQGRSNSTAYRLCQPGFLPRGKHFDLNKGFDLYDGTGNTLAVHDRAKFVGTLYLYDIAELIRETIFPYFQITLVDRYYDAFVHRCTTFERMQEELERPPNVIDEFLLECLDAHVARVQPQLVGVTVPFARNLYWAFRIGRHVKGGGAATRVAMGGGFFNTSMREQKDARVFDYVDYITLDDGEKPILNILEHLQGGRSVRRLKRTWHRQDGALVYDDGDPEGDIRHAEAGAPDYTGYPVANYFSSLETNNINQRVRSDGWWNKLTMTHGCYWKKCSFYGARCKNLASSRGCNGVAAGRTSSSVGVRRGRVPWRWTP